MSDTAHDNRILSNAALSLLWFGAAVSLAEILTGTFFAPLGWEGGLAAIAVGHVIGGVLFFLVCYVSSRGGIGAMEAAKRTFGRAGGVFFAGCNVVQLVGWTAIMVASGAAAAAYLVPALGMAGWALVIGALIVVWIALGTQWMSRVQSGAAVLLFALTVVVSFAVFGGEGAPAGTGEAMSFGAAVELAAAMPLSWLPVAGDYTARARHPLAGSVGATLAYTAGSCWMFAIGLGCALAAGTDDVAAVLAAAGLGVVGILVVVFSTVTTTFLDAQSAGESAAAIAPVLNARVVGVAAAVVGTVLAIVAPVGNFEDFLYLIGSIFAPMATVVVADALGFGRLARVQNATESSALPLLNIPNALLWLAGFVLYRVSLGWDLPCGNTLPVMLIIAAATAVVGLVQYRLTKKVSVA